MWPEKDFWKSANILRSNECGKLWAYLLSLSDSLQIWHYKWACNTLLGSKGFCCQKCHFLFVEKCEFCQKFCQKYRILPFFAIWKYGFLTAVNLLYKVLPKVSRLLAFTFYFICQKMQTFWEILPRILNFAIFLSSEIECLLCWIGSK